MANFLYNPGVRVYIDTGSDRHGLVDVTEDLQSGTMVRRSDGVSTFDFQINNPQRVYDNVFMPNDRIVVTMKRLKWIRTFTGLLNSVPLFSAWPQPVTIRASCSLKRLQYWFWDPYAPQSINMLLDAEGPSSQDVEGQPNASVDHKADDLQWGITNMVLTVLDKVVGWAPSKVHIAQIPPRWYDVAVKIARSVSQATDQADVAAQQYLDQLGATANIGGTSPGALGNSNVKSGSYGGVKLNQSQVDFAYTIYAVAVTKKLPAQAGMLGIMCAMQESTLRNLSYGDADSVGLFQQRPSQGWGSVAQIMNPRYAAGKFFDALVKVRGWQSMAPTQAVQAVQRSAYPDAYAQWQKMAEALVKQIQSVAPTKGYENPGGPSNGTGTGVPSSSGANNDGSRIADFAYKLTSKYHISYSQGTPRDMGYALSTPPPKMDCSLFAGSCFYAITGKKCWGTYPSVATIDAWCQAHGGKKISSVEAMNTPGAFLIRPAQHIEICVGDGKHTIGSRNPRTYAGVAVTDPNTYAYGILAPGASYQTYGYAPVVGDNGTVDDSGSSSALSLAGQSHLTKYSDTEGYNANNPIDSLFGAATWNPELDTDQMNLSSALTGVRALMNDQPVLPYITNMLNTSMRSLCSAPNGDLMAWFPDYYGQWKQAAIMVIETVELLNFTIDWSDDSMVTHMFTTVSQPGAAWLDPTTGQWAQQGIYPNGSADEIGMRVMTTGIASIDIPAMMNAIFGIDATEEQATDFAQFIYKRFGARPLYEEVPGLTGPTAELFSAIFKFMLYWGYQYNADVPLTFMPELWPGMLLQIRDFSFQCYVTTVTHTFDLSQGGGFYTTVNVAAPARLNNEQGGIFMGLPEAGGFVPTGGGAQVKPLLPGAGSKP